MMLVGYGGNGHAGEWLTDTILLLRYDPNTKTVLQLNIPRDLYVYVPYGGKDKGSWGKIKVLTEVCCKKVKPGFVHVNRKQKQFRKNYCKETNNTFNLKSVTT